MKNNFNVLFFLRKQKTVSGAQPIYLRVTINGCRFSVSINRQIPETNWIARLGKAKGVSEEIKTLNSYLTN
jgi:hypothetical protein